MLFLLQRQGGNECKRSLYTNTEAKKIRCVTCSRIPQTLTPDLQGYDVMRCRRKNERCSSNDMEMLRLLGFFLLISQSRGC